MSSKMRAISRTSNPGAGRAGELGETVANYPSSFRAIEFLPLLFLIVFVVVHGGTGSRSGVRVAAHHELISFAFHENSRPRRDGTGRQQERALFIRM